MSNFMPINFDNSDEVANSLKYTNYQTWYKKI